MEMAGVWPKNNTADLALILCCCYNVAMLQCIQPCCWYVMTSLAYTLKNELMWCHNILTKEQNVCALSTLEFFQFNSHWRKRIEAVCIPSICRNITSQLSKKKSQRPILSRDYSAIEKQCLSLQYPTLNKQANYKYIKFEKCIIRKK